MLRAQRAAASRARDWGRDSAIRSHILALVSFPGPTGLELQVSHVPASGATRASVQLTNKDRKQAQIRSNFSPYSLSASLLVLSTAILNINIIFVFPRMSIPLWAVCAHITLCDQSFKLLRVKQVVVLIFRVLFLAQPTTLQLFEMFPMIQHPYDLLLVGSMPPDPKRQPL